jgi:hypothetical protein
MDGFKNSTKTKYMCGGPVKKARGGDVKMREGGRFNERGKRATMAEIAAEDRRMSKRKPPVEGVSTRPTDSSGRRATDADLGMMRSVKKAPNLGAVTDREMKMLKKAVPAYSDKPMVRRKAGGLASMPKGKC